MMQEVRDIRTDISKETQWMSQEERAGMVPRGELFESLRLII